MAVPKLLCMLVQIKLQLTLILYDVLHIPSFKQNLLSITKLTQTSKLIVKFIFNKCILQDLMRNEVVAETKAQKGLYILDTKYFTNEFVSYITISRMYSLQHNRLGHISKNKVLHIHELNISFT